MDTWHSDFVAHMVRQGKNPLNCERAGRVIERCNALATARGKELTPEMYAEWLNIARRSGASASTVRSRFFAGKAYFEWSAGDAGMLAQYRLPSLPEPVPHPLPGGMADVRALLAHSSGEVNMIIALQGFAGLRISEARALTVHDIDWNRRELVIKGKGEKTRRVPISAELAPYLADNTVTATGHYVTMSDRGARAAITRVARAAGVIGAGGSVASHDLRATFGTAVYEKTGNILLVSRLLGHASVTTTQAYICTGNGAREAVEL